MTTTKRIDVRAYVGEAVAKVTEEVFQARYRDSFCTMYLYYQTGALRAFKETDDTTGWTVAINERLPANCERYQLANWLRERVARVPFLPPEVVA